MMTTSMERMLAKYTAHVEPVKVWKVTTTSGNCRNCIFNQRSHDEDGGMGYACNKRNLTAQGWKLDGLFIAVNFDSWRCDTDTRFSYKPGRYDTAAKSRQARNEVIFTKYAIGMSVKEISEEMSLKYNTVYSILKRKK